MNSFVKKSLGAWFVLQLAVWVLSAQTTLDLGSLPLWFEAVPGGSGPSQFVARGRDSSLTISTDGVQFSLRRSSSQTASARMKFVGANLSAGISGADGLAAKINYFDGNDPARWQPGLAAFGRVRVQNVYPGINVVYYGNQQRLEYDFDLVPGAMPQTIALRFVGADKVAVNSAGELVVTLAGRDIIQHQPVAYQTFGNDRHPVPVGYRILDAHTVAFSVGHFDPRLPLVIDPVLSYSTFFGGNFNDTAYAVAFGTNDNSVYIAGQTLSTAISSTLRFATPGAYQTNFQGGPQVGDAFVAKFHDLGTNGLELNDLATNLVYCTYLGGSGEDAAFALAVDAAGHAFVAGETYSTNFPATNSIKFLTAKGWFFDGSTNHAAKYDPAISAFPSDAFVSELDTNGAHLIYSTYLGGESLERAFGIAVDPNDNAYVTGYTSSTNFPVTANAFQPSFASVNDFYLGYNAFVSEISSNGGTLNYSSYLGGTNVDCGFAISFNNGYVAVAGATCSSNFPTLNWIHQYVTASNYYDGHVLNGSTNNLNNSLQLDPYICDAFVTLFQAAGSTLTPPLYSTFLGGTNSDVAYGVAVGPSGTVYAVGSTTSSNFPNTAYPGQIVLNSFLRTNTIGLILTNSFITEINWNGTNAVIGYSQIFGGDGNDFASAVALDGAGNVFVVGQASSLTNLNATTNLVGSLTYTNAATGNVLVTVFKSDFSSLLYSAYFGSSLEDFGHAIAVGPDDSAYIVGLTLCSPGADVSFPILNAWEPTLPDDNNGFLTKIWLTPPSFPVLSASKTGTNLLITWSAVPLAQINTNTFFLQTNTNLVASVVSTNFIYQTNTLPFTTNEIIETNLVAATNWANVSQPPFSTNEFVDGLTNQFYTYKFNLTNQARYFRLHNFNY